MSTLPSILFLKHARAPFTKPAPGMGINWNHPFAQRLVHSFPFSEGRGQMAKDYCWPRGMYDIGWQNPGNPVAGTGVNAPVWGVYDTVPGLFVFKTDNPLLWSRDNYVSGGSLNTLLPVIDFTKGFTCHLWMRTTVNADHSLILYGETSPFMKFEIGITAFFGVYRPRVFLTADGTNFTDFPGPTVWNTIGDIPYEHIISYQPGGPIMWYTSNGDEFNLGTSSIVPPFDNNQSFVRIGQDPGLGLPAFEGNIWGVNIFNRPMGFYTAMGLMTNPTAMYMLNPSGGALIGIIPPIVDPIPPPSGGAGGSDFDDDALTKSQICVDIL